MGKKLKPIFRSPEIRTTFDIDAGVWTVHLKIPCNSKSTEATGEFAKLVMRAIASFLTARIVE